MFVSRVFTEPHTFTSGAEGPACDRDGNLYAVNYARQHTIGKVTPEGVCSVFLTLPGGSVGNGICFNRAGEMFVADYVNHTIFKVELKTKTLSVHAHEPRMNQPNDLAVAADGTLYASDPDWHSGTGQLWRMYRPRRQGDVVGGRYRHHQRH